MHILVTQAESLICLHIMPGFRTIADDLKVANNEKSANHHHIRSTIYTIFFFSRRTCFLRLHSRSGLYIPHLGLDLGRGEKSVGFGGTVLNLRTKYLKAGRRMVYNATSMRGAAIIHPSNAWTMLSNTSREAWPVTTFFIASEVNGKRGPPQMNSPSRKKGIIRLNSIGVAMKLASITLGAWQRCPNSAIANPQRNTVTPQMGKIPTVMPTAVENASSFGSVPLLTI